MNGFLPPHTRDGGPWELLVAQTSPEKPQGGLFDLKAKVTFSGINNKNNKEHRYVLSTYPRLDPVIMVLYCLVLFFTATS